MYIRKNLESIIKMLKMLKAQLSNINLVMLTNGAEIKGRTMIMTTKMMIFLMMTIKMEKRHRLLISELFIIYYIEGTYFNYSNII